MHRKLNECALATYCIPLQIDLSAEFTGLGAKIRTESKSELGEHLREFTQYIDGEQPDNWLIVDIESPVEPFDSAFEAARYARPRLMILLSAISYLADYPFLPAQSVSGRVSLIETPVLIGAEPEVITFRVGGTDFRRDLRTLLLALADPDESTRSFLASALDRFRRGLYLHSESAEEPLFDDEAFLAYFHTLELLSHQCSKSQTKELETELSVFLKPLLRDTLKASDQSLEERSIDIKKQIISLLVQEGNLPTSSSIKYFLDQRGLLAPGVADLVDRLVTIRNSVAHGKQVYRDDLIWPVPQFFPLHPDTGFYLESIKLLAAQGIAALVDVRCWQSPWNQLIRDLPPSVHTVRAFVRSQQYSKISHRDFVSGTLDGVTPSAIVELYVSKKLQLKQLVEILSPILTSNELEADWKEELTVAAAILSDAEDQSLADRCRQLVREWEDPRDLRVIYRDLQYSGVTLHWLRDFLRSESTNQL
ncbi:MAG: hypothetical protein ABII79_02040 [bacterium]